MKGTVGLSEASFEPEIRQVEGPVGVDFYAPWCGPCRMLAPLLEQLAGESAGTVKFAKLNLDAAPERAAPYGDTGVPTLMLYRGGEPIDRMVGLASPRSLRTWPANAAAEAATA